MWDQLVVGVSPGDAITQCALLLREQFRGLGPSELYSQFFEPGVPGDIRPLEDLPDRPNRDRPLVFHASMGSWAVHQAIMAYEPRLVLYYHNFSPPEPYIQFAPNVASDLISGRWELDTIRDRVEIVVAASEFSAKELVQHGYRDIAIVPPTPDVGRLQRLTPAHGMRRQIQEWGPGPLVLCVAQQLPHKRLERVIAAVALLQQEYEPQATLVLVGVDRFETYTNSLIVLADTVGLNRMEMLGRISNEELAALYGAADIFVTLSEHEGFCIPVVEAMACSIPVVASNRAAIPEAVGNAGILIDDPDDALLVASMLREVTTNRELRDTMIARGRARATDLSATATLPELFRCITGLELPQEKPAAS